MRLKTLEIKGFKSFADETVLHFDEDVIGIVGPNGSGKSNIVDAVRWVLGEQKGKELRLESMGDVLFNGTKKRKPGGVAQVTVTFENTKNILPTEYQSVSISRILYRSGESEYRLNGVTCRLKDIQSLLIDTGIGSNSYAIIALGMVDDILHNKDHARRRMFEQAAGISKYKRRKHETLLKLKNTTADLDRIEDLLFEIQGNLKTLEKQARRTRRYVDLKELYKVQSINMAVRKTAHLRERYADLDGQIETERDVLRQHEVDLQKKEVALQKIKKESLDEEKTVSAKQRDLNILVGTIRNLENDRSLKEQQISFLQQSVKKLDTQLAENASKLEEIDKEVTEKAHELQSAARHAENLKSIVAERKHARDAVEQKYLGVKSRRDGFSARQRSVEADYIELERAFAEQNSRITQTSSQLSEYREEIAQLDTEIARQRRQSAALESEMEKLRNELNEKESVVVTQKEHIDQLERKREDIRTALVKCERTFDAKQNERELLRDMINKLEGYPESIKYLSKSGKWTVKAPLLSDIIYCAPEHRAKVEHLLGPYLNDYVVRDTDEAAAAISLLSAAQKGKANFFILDRLPAKKSSPLNIPGATPLSEFIQVDDEYAPLMDYLLGSTYLTSEPPTSPEYARDAFAHCTFVDEQGTMFVHPGSMSGGSIGLFEGKKLGRAKNLEILDKEIKALQKEMDRYQRDLDAVNLELQLARDEVKLDDISEVRNALYACKQSLGESNAVLAGLTANREQIVKKQNTAEESLHAVKGEMQTTERKLTSLRSEMEESTTSWEDADAEYGALMNAFSEANAAYNEVHLEYVQQSSIVDNLESAIKFRSRQMSDLRNQMESDTSQRNSDLQEIGETQGEIENISSALIEHYAQKKKQEAELSSAEQQYFEARNVIQDLEDKVRSISRERQNSEYLVNQLKEEHQDIRFKLSSVSERLQIEFNTSLEDVQPDPEHDDIPLEELEMKVEKLRNRIENFGEINPMAMEAYEEMKERYDTINDQKIDILEARESLMETIREIEMTATAKFSEAFAQVREYFVQVFRNLFTADDSCDLLLSDPSNPLESDILIIAKPKGKRPKSLSQLSGGEKTLTATALLFALYLLKPAPFCIFDEVDAPLDDANIVKFNRIIKTFSEQSQFVIVTHNKQTMAAVDIIYGVYMEEQGVSTLSPVDFRYLQHEAVLEAGMA